MIVALRCSENPTPDLTALGQRRQRSARRRSRAGRQLRRALRRHLELNGSQLGGIEDDGPRAWVASCLMS